jgi:hypothetical protein
VIIVTTTKSRSLLSGSKLKQGEDDESPELHGLASTLAFLGFVQRGDPLSSGTFGVGASFATLMARRLAGEFTFQT